MLRTKLLPTFQGVASNPAGGNDTIALCELLLGLRYHSITLEIGCNEGVTLSSGNLLGEIILEINGNAQRRILATELNALNALNGVAWALKTTGVAGTAGYRTYLTIWLAEPWRKDTDEGRAFAWNAVGINSFNLKVNIKAGLTGVTVTGFFDYDSPVSQGIGKITKWIRESFAMVGSSQTFKLERKDVIHSISLFPPVGGGYVNKAKLTANGAEVRDLLTTAENAVLLLNREMNPDTSAVPRYDLVLDYDDPLAQALPADALTELALYVEYSAAVNGNGIALIQRSGTPA